MFLKIDWINIGFIKMLCTIGMLISREPEVEVILLVKLHAIHFYPSLLFKIWAQKPLACAYHIRYAMLR